MTGWRIGWLVAPEHLSEPINRLNQNLFISAPTASQRGALAALQPEAKPEVCVCRGAGDHKLTKLNLLHLRADVCLF